LGTGTHRCWAWYASTFIDITFILTTNDIAGYLDFRTNKPGDVISTLISIYDSKDLFVKELQVLLAQKLLAIKDGNFDNEVCVLHDFMVDCRNQREFSGET
jgi:hypothetical protein